MIAIFIKNKGLNFNLFSFHINYLSLQS